MGDTELDLVDVVVLVLVALEEVEGEIVLDNVLLAEELTLAVIVIVLLFLGEVEGDLDFLLDTECVGELV